MRENMTQIYFVYVLVRFRMKRYNVYVDGNMLRERDRNMYDKLVYVIAYPNLVEIQMCDSDYEV